MQTERKLSQERLGVGKKEFEDLTKKSWKIDSDLLTVQIFDGGRDEGCRRRIAARIEKSGQVASMEGCSCQEENPTVGAHKQ
ncbi:hypothetical protein WN943_000933 [Citrus x changshan-huyou]